MKKEVKKCTNGGITLIALVITIIVLLILAAITINLTLGENGILKRAEESRTETRGATVEEARNLWRATKGIDKRTNSSTAQPLEQLINELVEKKQLTEDEKDIILGNEEKGIKAEYEITIGTKTIDFYEEERKSIVFYIDDVKFEVKEGSTWRDFIFEPLYQAQWSAVEDFSADLVLDSFINTQFGDKRINLGEALFYRYYGSWDHIWVIESELGKIPLLEDEIMENGKYTGNSYYNGTDAKSLMKNSGYITFILCDSVCFAREGATWKSFFESLSVDDFSRGEFIGLGSVISSVRDGSLVDGDLIGVGRDGSTYRIVNSSREIQQVNGSIIEDSVYEFKY